MNYKKRQVAALILATALSASPVYATLVDTGYVNPSNSADQANYNGTMTVGGYLGNGSFEVNTSTAGNGLTAASNQGMTIGSDDGFTGTVRVIGDGTYGSARIDIRPTGGSERLNVGAFGGTGILNISNGGVVEVHAGRTTLGQSGNAEVNIDGMGSELISSGIYTYNSSTVNISNGGHMSTTSTPGTIWVEGGAGSTATINVSGGAAETGIGSAHIGIDTTNPLGNSYLNVNNGIVHADSVLVRSMSGDAKISADNNSYIEAGNIDIGNTNKLAGYTAAGMPTNHFVPGEIGQQAIDNNGELLYYKDGSPVLNILDPRFGLGMPETLMDGNRIYLKTTGELVVENSSIVIAQTVNVSANGVEADGSTEEATSYNNKKSVLTVRSGSEVIADVNIYTDGVLNGDGTITGNVIVDGGMIAAGNSPGTLNIDGDLTVIDGVFSIELGFGGVSDIINVAGNAIFGPDVIFEILLGDTFTGNQIDLTNIILASNFFIDNSFDPLNNILLLVDGGSALLPGAQISVDFGGNSPILLSTTDQAGADAVPEPTLFWLLGFGMLGLMGSRKATFRDSILEA